MKSKQWIRRCQPSEFGFRLRSFQVVIWRILLRSLGWICCSKTCFFQRERPQKSTKNPHQHSPGNLLGKNPLGFLQKPFLTCDPAGLAQSPPKPQIPAPETKKNPNMVGPQKDPQKEEKIKAHILAIFFCVCFFLFHISEGRKWGVRSVVVEIGVFGAPPISSPEVPKYLFLKGFGTSERKSGRPKNAKFNHDGTDPHLRPSEYECLWSQSWVGDFVC